METPASGAAPPPPPPLLSTLWLADLCIGIAAPGLNAPVLAGVELVWASCGVVHWPARPAALGKGAEGVLGCWCTGACSAGEGGVAAAKPARGVEGVVGCQGASCSTAGGPDAPGCGGGGIAAYGCAAEGAALCWAGVDG